MAYRDPKYKTPKEKLKHVFPKTKGMQIHCSNCDHEIEHADINIDKAIAKCSNCNNVFSFEEEVRDVRQRPEIFMPEGIEMMEFMSELDIRYKWRHAKPMNGFLMAFTIIWNVMLLPFILMAIASGQWVVLLGISAHLAVGVGLIMHMITTFFNSTYLIVDEHEIIVEHAPIRLPFFVKDQYINVESVEQLYVKKYTSSKTNGRPNYAYAVHVKKNTGDDIRLLKGFTSKDKALYIEQEIERYLGILDRRVEEESGY